MHVSVQRDNQFRRRNALPSTGINVVPSNHPPQEKVEPFAGTPLARSWNQEITSFRKYILHKGRKRRDHGVVITAKPRHEALLKGTMFLNDPPHAPEQAGKILPGRKPAIRLNGESRRKPEGDGPILLRTRETLLKICFTFP
jgi:hypothetical protein